MAQPAGYRDDLQFCEQTRLGEAHGQHVYAYEFIDSSIELRAGRYDCPGLNRDGGRQPWPERPRETSPWAQLLALIGDATVVVWVCPDGHSDTVKYPDRRHSVTVQWLDGIAHCTMPGCDRTSTDHRPANQAD